MTRVDFRYARGFLTVAIALTFTVGCVGSSASSRDGLFSPVAITFSEVKIPGESSTSFVATIPFSSPQAAKQFSQQKPKALRLLTVTESSEEQAPVQGWFSNQTTYLKVYVPRSTTCGDKGMSRTPGPAQLPCAFGTLEFESDSGQTLRHSIGYVVLPPHDFNTGGKSR